MEMRMVYITCSNLDEAKRIGRKIVEERLCACVNIIEGIHSFYWWKGNLEQDRECAIIAKTKKGLMDELIKRVKELHSYECPCIVSIPLKEGNPDFFNWIEQETKG